MINLNLAENKKINNSKIENYIHFDFCNLNENDKLPKLTWTEQPENAFSVIKSKFIPIYSINSYKIITKIKKKKDCYYHKPDLAQLNFKKNELISNKDWTNKIIHGDSLIGMASMLEEGFEEQIQMVFMDPPYGINFNAKNKLGSIKSEGYLDNWKKGLPSYLEYLKKRLILIKKLLKKSGSLFVQIGEANIHYVRCLLDEIFGPKNFVNQIMFRTAISTNNIQSIGDYLLWYSKDKKSMLKFNLFTERSKEKIEKTFTYSEIDIKSGKKQFFKAQELIKRNNNSIKGSNSRNFKLNVNGNEYLPPSGFEWRWDKQAMEKLISLNRIHVINNKLYGKRYESDFPEMILTNMWNDTSTSTFAAKKHYSVHTNPKVIQRCIAMTTRAGDLVMDPTSGSGTAAIVAEKLHRRWIVFDTNANAILSTSNWLLGTQFPIIKLNLQENDLEYSKLNKISLSNLAKDKFSPIQEKYDQPKIQNKKGRLASQFLIEKIDLVSISDFSTTILYLIQNNGILLPTGENLYFNSVTEKKIKLDLSYCELYYYEGLVNSKKIDFFFIQIKDKFNTEKFMKIFINFIKSKKILNHVIISSHFSSFFINKIHNFQNNLIQKKNSLQKISLATLNQDIFINEINFQKHPESILLNGRVKIDTKNDIEISFFNYDTDDYEVISHKEMSFWGLKQIKPQILDGFDQKDIDIIQLPFYKQYCDKELLNYYCLNNFNDFLKLFIKEINKTSNLLEIICIDYRGVEHYGFFNVQEG